MGNNFGGGFNNNGFGMRLPNDEFKQNNNFTTNITSKDPTQVQPFRSIDGRNFTTKDQAFQANQEFYRRMLNESMNKKQ